MNEKSFSLFVFFQKEVHRKIQLSLSSLKHFLEEKNYLKTYDDISKQVKRKKYRYPFFFGGEKNCCLNPLHQGWFVPRLVEIVTVVLGQRILKVNTFLLYHNYLYLIKNVTQGCLVPSLVEIGQVVSEKGISKYHQLFKMLFHFENFLYWKDIRCP